MLEGLAAGVAAVLPLSCCVLGMGEDMHIASLFPGAVGLAAALAADAPPLKAVRAPGTGEPRVTLTAPVLNASLHIHLLIAGAGKRAALDRAARCGRDTDAPVRVILNAAAIHYAE